MLSYFHERILAKQELADRFDLWFGDEGGRMANAIKNSTRRALGPRSVGFGGFGVQQVRVLPRSNSIAGQCFIDLPQAASPEVALFGSHGLEWRGDIGVVMQHQAPAHQGQA